MLSLEGICKAYGGRMVLDHVSLPFAPGRITALVGPNGSGKTTLIKIVLGLVRADAGHVCMDGEPVGADGGYRARIGYAPQAPHLPPHLTVGELVALLGDLRPGAPTDDALLDAFGLRTEWDSPIGTLSGGWRQKLSLAVAWRFRPDVLILDEPTAGLDEVASGLLKQALHEARAQGRTVLITSHLPGEVAELADDVVRLGDGRLRPPLRAVA